ncbi:hypothetical protein HNR06_002450 [Nocardiopsis arvandica]|uniref:Uncharacterized protein n=1 Tax=Nocardiopsis sinuspersici TaxID=501010 RepID=A0A7Z0BJ90_9ACTN|nr:hypothetical protein [Nocardiopsis sinuspersici]NYH52861.1 hypothetical protein [Nocardiopsis sinuspersici]
MMVAGTAVAALSTAWTLGSGPLLSWSAPLYFAAFLSQAAVVGVAGFAATRARLRPLLPPWLGTRAGQRWWRVLSLGFAPATMATWFLFSAPDWVLTVGWHAPGAVCAAAALWAGWWWPRNERLAAAHADRYLVAGDLGRYGSELVLRVQRTIDAVVEADRRLGDSFDSTRSLAVLRDEEWRIASMLYHHDRLREEHRADSREAASDRVRALLNRQHERQEAAYRELAAQVDAIREYGVAVEEALNAHKEWEQLERSEIRGAQLDELLARSASGEGSGELLRDEVLDARAAKEARDELIDRALEAGRLLEASKA